MTSQTFDYEEVFMGVRDKKPPTYFRSFNDDYRLRFLTKAISLKKGNLLDVGCGGGILTESFPYYYPDADIFGCDISRQAISYARKLGSGKVKYAVIKNKKLSYKAGFFDVCICFDVLEHVQDVDFFLDEVKRVLKKNGKFFLIVPCEGQKLTYTWLFQKIHLGQNLTNRYFGHIHPEFTYKGVIKLLEKHNFIIRETGFSEHLFYQFSHLFIFFLPKLLLELFFGESKAKQYSNSSLISSPKSNHHPLMIIRRMWFIFFNFMMMYPMSWETIILRKFPIGAWKLHVLSESL